MNKTPQDFPRRSECSYPGDETAHHQYTFCCAPVVPGKSYCLKHMKVVYSEPRQPRTPIRGSR